MRCFEPEESEEYLHLSGVLHFAFCKRRWALIHIEQQWGENSLTFSGRIMHKNADNPFFTESRGDTLISRSLPIVSHALKIYGIADVVEFHRSDTGISLPKHEGRWSVIPVEYKSGKKNSFGSDEVQLCCQALCLEEMFHSSISSGYVYYGKNKRRVEVSFDMDLRKRVKMVIQEMYSLFQRGETPPAVYQKYCENCSLLNLCLPQLSEKKQSVASYLRQEISR